MNITALIPTIALIIYMVFMIAMTFNSEKSIRFSWIIPALASALFFILSVTAVINEGSMGFWTEHIRNLWGNQIWVDLLLAASIGWFLIVPEAKARKMRLIPWLFLIFATGCIGFTAMVARLLYLREKSLV